mmetsp:Transcript_5432/g.5586  ORF Transcript_5432/g.5586 Transcript_5432/m.5586 type:complete len:129 (+) Transcript_5432:341-727(+)
MILKGIIEERYPNLRDKISGENYPPAFYCTVIANFTTYLWLTAIFLVVAGDTVFNTLGIPYPQFYTQIKENKMQFMIVMFLINSFGANMLKTGAFEIIFDGEVIFSKLELHRLPEVPELFAILDKRLL